MKKAVKKEVLISIIVILLLAVSSALILLFRGEKIKHPVTEIYSDNELIYQIDLTLVDKPYTITVQCDTGGENVIEVRPMAIGVISADCPDRTCVNTGFTSGKTRIVCVPHRLEIRVEDAGQPDAVAR